MPLRTLWIHVRIPRHSLGEFPHSDICGSRFIYNSPQLFAVSHVLHRRQVPRHPPYALRSLIIKASFDASKSYNVLSLVCILSKISYIVNRSYYSLLFISLDIFPIDEIPYPSWNTKPPMQLSMCFSATKVAVRAIARTVGGLK